MGGREESAKVPDSLSILPEKLSENTWFFLGKIYKVFFQGIHNKADSVLDTCFADKV